MSQSTSTSSTSNYTLLTENASPLERALEKVFTKAIDGVAPPLPSIRLGSVTPEHLIPHLAYERQVSYWHEGMSGQNYRDITSFALKEKRLSGTRDGIELALHSIGYGCEIKGKSEDISILPYSLDVIAWKYDNSPVDKNKIHNLIERLADIKSLRDTISVSLAHSVTTSLHVAAASPALTSVTTTTADAQLWDTPEGRAGIGVGGSSATAASITSTEADAVLTFPRINASVHVGLASPDLNVSITEIYATAAEENMDYKTFGDGTGYPIQITKKGLSELASAKNQGLKGAIDAIAFGDQSYKPSDLQTSLKNELDRIEIGQYVDTGETSVKMVGKVANNKEYPVREIGFYLSSGTLLGIISVPGELLNYKTKSTALIQIFVLSLAVLPTNSVEVIVGIENLNILIDEPMMSDAVAFCRSQKNQTNQLLAHMKLSDRIQKLETADV